MMAVSSSSNGPHCGVIWASSQHGGWVPSVNIPREANRSCLTFHDIASEVTKYHPSHSHMSTYIHEKTDPTSWWEESYSYIVREACWMRETVAAILGKYHLLQTLAITKT